MRLAFVSLPLMGHLNPLITLARSFQSRGHEVVFVDLVDNRDLFQAAGLQFVPYGEQAFPAGSLPKLLEPLSRLQGLDVIQHYASETFPKLLAAAFQDLPTSLSQVHADGLVLDRGFTFLGLIPMKLKLPFVHIWASTPVDLTGTTPPVMFSWPFNKSDEALAKYKDGAKQIAAFFAPIFPIVKAFADTSLITVNLSDPNSVLSTLATVTQMPKAFDFPDVQWPSHFHYSGPFYDANERQPDGFPWQQLDGRPLVYASFGTLTNGLRNLRDVVLETVERFPDLQVVLATGKHISQEQLGVVPANTIVVPYAPQIKLLARASLCVTLGGLNTVLGALAQGVPIVAIPVGFDQPGVAARVAYQGVGEFIDVDALTADRLEQCMRKVLLTPTYQDRVRSFQKAMADTSGVDLATRIIEEALTKR